MIDVFVLDDVNDADNVSTTAAASRLNLKCISIDPRSHPLSSVDSFSSDSFEFNNKDCHLSIQSSSFSSEDFDDNSSCDNVVKCDKQSKQTKQQHKQIPLKGILKYPFDWKINKNTINNNADLENNSKVKTTFNSSGPSSLDSDDQGYYGASCESPDSEKYLQNYVSTAQQSNVKKGVTWAEKDIIFVFRKGSSILGCRKKNQKKSKRKREKARLRDEDDFSGTEGSSMDSDIENVRLMIANQRFSVSEVEDFDSVSDASSSGCDCSTSEASGDEEVLSPRPLDEPLNYKDEKTLDGNSNKQKRKKQRKRNRKSKQTVRNRLETGYDSD